MVGIRDSISASSSPKINFTNLILRILQLIFAIIVVGFYASMYNSKLNKAVINDYGSYTLQHKLTLGVSIGSFSIITAIAFALIPAFISYYYVAIAFIWEWILLFVWCALFGWVRWITTDYVQSDDKDDKNLGHFNWVVLINLLLWLATAVMSVICLLHDRKSLIFGRSAV